MFTIVGFAPYSCARPRCTTLSWRRSHRAKALVSGLTGAHNTGPVRDACRGVRTSVRATSDIDKVLTVPFAEAPPDSLTLVGVPGESSWAARWPNCGRKLMVRGRALRGLTTVHRDDAFKTAPQSHGHIVSQPLADGSARTTGPLARSWRAGCAHLSDERVYVHPSASHPWVRVGRVQAE